MSNHAKTAVRIWIKYGTDMGASRTIFRWVHLQNPTSNWILFFSSELKKTDTRERERANARELEVSPRIARSLLLCTLRLHIFLYLHVFIENIPLSVPLPQKR